MKKIKVIAGVLSVFILGALTGVLGTGFFVRHKIDRFVKDGPPPLHHILMKRITHELDLSQAQQEAIGKVVEQMQTKLHELRQKHHPELETIFRQGIEQMKTTLNETQIQKLDAIYDDMKKHRERHSRFHHPPPPPPPDEEDMDDRS